MGLKQVTRDDLVEGLIVTSTQLMPRRAFRLAAKVAKYVAPAFAATGGKKISMESDISELMPAIIAMLIGLDEKDLDAALTEILSGSVVVRVDENNGKGAKYDLSNPQKIDAAFAGDLPGMMAVARLALEVNFGDFFAGGSKKEPPKADETPAP